MVHTCTKVPDNLVAGPIVPQISALAKKTCNESSKLIVRSMPRLAIRPNRHMAILMIKELERSMSRDRDAKEVNVKRSTLRGHYDTHIKQHIHTYHTQTTSSHLSKPSPGRLISDVQLEYSKCSV